MHSVCAPTLHTCHSPPRIPWFLRLGDLEHYRLHALWYFHHPQSYFHHDTILRLVCVRRHLRLDYVMGLCLQFLIRPALPYVFQVGVTVFTHNIRWFLSSLSSDCISRSPFLSPLSGLQGFSLSKSTTNLLRLPLALCM